MEIYELYFNIYNIVNFIIYEFVFPKIYEMFKFYIKMLDNIMKLI